MINNIYKIKFIPCVGVLWLFAVFIKGDVPTFGVGKIPAKFFNFAWVCRGTDDGLTWLDNLTLILIFPDGHLGNGSGCVSISSISFRGVCKRLTLCATNAVRVNSKSHNKRLTLDRSICYKIKSIYIIFFFEFLKI